MKSKILIYPVVVLGVLLMVVSGCKKDETISSKKDPIITWANPTDITYGTLLSATQLNATADVAGTFVYAPALGASLNVGENQNLKVDFTPTDAVNYNTATKTVTINVIAIQTVTDVDDNVYHTITIGTQTWMVENLKTTHYNDGTAITNITNNTAWTTQTVGAYCWQKNDIANKATYGALYNWYTVNTAKLAPTGWHVPTNDEWQILIDYLGGDAVAGGKMKTTTLWDSPNTGATNSSSFTALPGGSRDDRKGVFYIVGSHGLWWSSSASGASDAWFCYLSYEYANAICLRNNKLGGFSVRCVRD